MQDMRDWIFTAFGAKIGFVQRNANHHILRNRTMSKQDLIWQHDMHKEHFNLFPRQIVPCTGRLSSLSLSMIEVDIADGRPDSMM